MATASVIVQLVIVVAAFPAALVVQKLVRKTGLLQVRIRSEAY